MDLFVYEFVSGGGWQTVFNQRPTASLLAEGRLMRDALIADFENVERVANVQTLEVSAGEDEREAFYRKANQADWTIVIAPEFRDVLAERHRWVLDAGGRLLGQPERIVTLAAHKDQTARFLLQSDILTPHGITLPAGAQLPRDFAYPAVIKPLDGMGSMDVEYIDGPTDIVEPYEADRRLEVFCPGTAASISYLCGPAGHFALPTSQQLLSDDGRFSYLGSRWPLPEPLARRARVLGDRVMEKLPDAFSYMGMDLVLGDDPHGHEDYVIEINPRLTTSYIGLRKLAQANLAEAMLRIATGEPVELNFDSCPLRISSDVNSHKQPARETT